MQQGFPKQSLLFVPLGGGMEIIMPEVLKPHDSIEIKEFENFKMYIIKTPHLNIETTFYFLETAKELFIIDTAVPAGIHILKQALEQVDLDGKKIFLLNTHEHWDHQGCNDYVKSLGAFNGCHKYGKRGIRDKEFGWRSMYECFFDDLPIPDGKYELYNEHSGGFGPADFYFNDGDLFEGKNVEIEVIHTPGHSASSCCFYEKNTKILFSGDSIQGTGFYDNLPFLMTASGYADSLRKLLAYDIECIYGGHEIIEGAEAVKEYLAGSIDTYNKLERKVTQMFDELKPRYMKEGDFAKIVAEEMGKVYNFQAFHCVHAIVEKLRLGM